jgi:hypothetical protein
MRVRSVLVAVGVVLLLGGGAYWLLTDRRSDAPDESVALQRCGVKPMRSAPAVPQATVEQSAIEHSERHWNVFAPVRSSVIRARSSRAAVEVRVPPAFAQPFAEVRAES